MQLVVISAYVTSNDSLLFSVDLDRDEPLELYQFVTQCENPELRCVFLVIHTTGAIIDEVVFNWEGGGADRKVLALQKWDQGQVLISGCSPHNWPHCDALTMLIRIPAQIFVRVQYLKACQLSVQIDGVQQRAESCGCLVC